MGLKYKEGDVVFVKVRITDTDTADEFLCYEIQRAKGNSYSIWVGANEVFDVLPTPEPTPAASPTRPDGEPPMNVRIGRPQLQPFAIGHATWFDVEDLNSLTDWGIEWDFLTWDASESIVFAKITAVSQTYMDAVAEKQAADAKQKFYYEAYIMSPDKSTVYYVTDYDRATETYSLIDNATDVHVDMPAAQLEGYEVISEHAASVFRGSRRFDIDDIVIGPLSDHPHRIRAIGIHEYKVINLTLGNHTAIPFHLAHEWKHAPQDKTQFDPSSFGPSGKPFGSPRQD